MRTACTTNAFRRWLRHAWLALAMWGLAAFSLSSAAQTADSAELAVHPQSVQLAGLDLARHGAGIRYKAIFKVYSAALYLEKPVRSLEDIAALPGPKRVTVSMLRNINASELGKLFAHGMEDNMDKQQFSQLIPGVLRMSEVFNRHKELKTGDQFTLDWIPQQGMVLSVNGKPDPAPFPDAAFYQAMLGIWLGPKPADSRLKAQLLNNAL